MENRIFYQFFSPIFQDFVIFSTCGTYQNFGECGVVLLRAWGVFSSLGVGNCINPWSVNHNNQKYFNFHVCNQK